MGFFSKQTMILAQDRKDNKFDFNVTSQLLYLFPIHICISLD
jgi:hypothetical protein